MNSNNNNLIPNRPRVKPPARPLLQLQGPKLPTMDARRRGHMPLKLLKLAKEATLLPGDSCPPLASLELLNP